MEELGRREQRLEFENRKREIIIKMPKKENEAKKSPWLS